MRFDRDFQNDGDVEEEIERDLAGERILRRMGRKDREVPQPRGRMANCYQGLASVAQIIGSDAEMKRYLDLAHNATN